MIETTSARESNHQLFLVGIRLAALPYVTHELDSAPTVLLTGQLMLVVVAGVMVKSICAS